MSNFQEVEDRRCYFLFDDDVQGIQTPHDDAVIISMMIANYDVKRIFINNKNSMDILFYDTFQYMKLPTN